MRNSGGYLPAQQDQCDLRSDHERSEQQPQQPTDDHAQQHGQEHHRNERTADGHHQRDARCEHEQVLRIRHVDSHLPSTCARGNLR